MTNVQSALSLAPQLCCLCYCMCTLYNPTCLQMPCLNRVCPRLPLPLACRLRPNMAHHFPFELDTFQKEAICHLEQVSTGQGAAWPACAGAALVPAALLPCVCLTK